MQKEVSWQGVPLCSARCRTIALRLADLILMQRLDTDKTDDISIFNKARDQVKAELHTTSLTIGMVWKTLGKAARDGACLSKALNGFIAAREDGRKGSEGGFKAKLMKSEAEKVDRVIQDYMIPNKIWITGKSVAEVVLDKLGKHISSRSARRLIYNL